MIEIMHTAGQNATGTCWQSRNSPTVRGEVLARPEHRALPYQEANSSRIFYGQQYQGSSLHTTVVFAEKIFEHCISRNENQMITQEVLIC